MSLDLADDARNRIRRDVHAAVQLETVDGVDQADRADLHQVLDLLSSSRVAPCEALHERHVPPDQPFAGFEIAAPVVLVEQIARRLWARCGRPSLRAAPRVA